MRVISLSSLVCLIPLSIVVVMESVPETVKERVFAFGESDFLVENFNPEQFLAKYSTTCELEDLKSDITEFLQHCENAIMSIMNKDYESFISLAMRLNGLKEKISAIRTPLSESEGQLKIHKENLIRECEALASLLKRYRDVEERKHYLQQFMDLNSLLEEAEGIVNEEKQKNPTQMQVVDIMNMERSCRDICHASSILSSSSRKDVPFLIMSKDRIDALRKSVINILRSVFDRNVQGNSYNKKLALVLKCYVLLDMVEDIQNYYRENFVVPFIDTIITREKLDGANRNSCSGLSVILDSLYNYIANNCTSILVSSKEIVIMEPDEKSRFVYDFLISSIWSPIVDFIFRRIPNLFTCGAHSIFQHNYSLCSAFVTKLSQLADNQEYFWNHPKTISFFNKWELTVYITSLSLDFMTSQISVLLKKTVGESKETTASVQQKMKQDVPFQLDATTITYSLICRCFTQEVYIPRCCKDLLQLALALISRYLSYITDTLASFGIPEKETILASSSVSPQPSTPVSTPTIPDTCVPQLVDLVHDFVLLKNVLNDQFVTQTKNVLKEGSTELTVILKAFSYVLENEGNKVVNTLMDTLLTINLYNASTSISNARSVTSSYRMTNKPAPTSPSFYVSRILYYYEGFDKKYSKLLNIDSSLYSSWKTQLVDDVCLLFHSTIEDILHTISRMEEVLSKHRKRNLPGESVDGVDETDEEKMKHQLLLDVTALKSHISELNLVLPASYNNLFSMVYGAYNQKK